MNKLILLPCLALLVAAAPAASAPALAASDIAPSEAQQADGLAGGGKNGRTVEEKKICRQLETTGSRLPRRACLTEREWKKLQSELDQ
ncbi:MAG TPA: hypothetical protein VNR86_06905 [Sphingomicrobium sp.]|nr:hypothetical protein [Sphingomicrobium sp.]